MTYRLPNKDEQQVVFDYVRNGIDHTLRDVRLDEVLAERGIDVPEYDDVFSPISAFRKIVVARSYGFSTQAADMDRDLDPTATVMSESYEIGIAYEERELTRVQARSYEGFIVTSSLMGGEHEPAGIGAGMNKEQIEAITDGVHKLVFARKRNVLPYLTPSLLKIDLAGD